MKKDKNQKLAAALAVVAIIAAAVFFFLSEKAGGGPDEALKAMSAAIAGGNKAAVSELVSKQFNDAGLNYGAVVDELSIKRPVYNVTLDGVTKDGDKASVSYTRKDIVNKQPVTAKITNETWQKESDGKWRLFKFSAYDRGRIPEVIKQRKDAEAKLKAEKDAEEAAKIAARNVPYSYIGKRDPFSSLILEGVAEEGGGADSSVNCDLGRKRDYLEGFDLSTFKLSGVVFIDGAFALIEGQNGHGFTVKPGMHIGKRCGRISKISPDKVIIQEKYAVKGGGFEVRESELRLRDREDLGGYNGNQNLAPLEEKSPAVRAGSETRQRQLEKTIDKLE